MRQRWCQPLLAPLVPLTAPLSLIPPRFQPVIRFFSFRFIHLSVLLIYRVCFTDLTEANEICDARNVRNKVPFDDLSDYLIYLSYLENLKKNRASSKEKFEIRGTRVRGNVLLFMQTSLGAVRLPFCEPILCSPVRFRLSSWPFRLFDPSHLSSSRWFARALHWHVLSLPEKLKITTIYREKCNLSDIWQFWMAQTHVAILIIKRIVFHPYEIVVCKNRMQFLRLYNIN